jgi:hypothetical protein
MNRNIFKHVLTSVAAVAALAVLFVVAQSVVAQGNSQVDGFLYQNQSVVDKFQIGAKANFLDNFRTLSDFDNDQFTNQTGLALRIFGDSSFADVTISGDAEFNSLTGTEADNNIGQQTNAFLNVGYTPGQRDLARLQINGNFEITGLAEPGNTDLECVCANQFGVLYRCGTYDAVGDACIADPVPTYSWVTSPWGSCNGGSLASCSGSYSGGGTCSGTPTDGTLYRPRCSDDGNYPNQDYICATDPGEWVNTGTSCPSVTHSSLPNPPGFNDVFPYNLGQSVCLEDSRSSCSSFTTSPACNGTTGCSWLGGTILCDGASQLSCELENPACTWNAGTSGTQTRTVECQDNLGNVVADSFCTEVEPVSSQSC